MWLYWWSDKFSYGELFSHYRGVGGKLFLFLGFGIGDFEDKSAEKEWNLCVFF